MKKAEVYDHVSDAPPARAGSPAPSPCAYRATARSHRLQSILLLCLVSVSATLNGRTLDRPYFYHWDLVPGGRLFFEMGPKPNKEWGAHPEAAPPSVTKAVL